jgi:hypothetical protein
LTSSDYSFWNLTFLLCFCIVICYTRFLIYPKYQFLYFVCFYLIKKDFLIGISTIEGDLAILGLKMLTSVPLCIYMTQLHKLRNAIVGHLALRSLAWLSLLRSAYKIIFSFSLTFSLVIDYFNVASRLISFLILHTRVIHL